MLKDCNSSRGELTCIEGQFVFSRQIGFYFFRFYIPTTLIVMIRRIFKFIFWVYLLAEAFVENFSKLDSLLDFIKLWLWTNDNDQIEFRNSNSGCNSNSVRFRKMLHARILIRYQDRKSDWLAADWTESFWNWSSLSPCQQFQKWISQRSIFG